MCQQLANQGPQGVVGGRQGGQGPVCGLEGQAPACLAPLLLLLQPE